MSASDDNKVVHLAFANPGMVSDEISLLGCGTCRNKTFLVKYQKGEDFPAMTCAACGAHAGRIGWAPEE